MTLPASFLDDVRARTALSALVGKSVKLTKAGREFRACCPFHDEKTPSFYVNDDKGFWHCFGCSAHGDAIRWMTHYKGLPFIDAVKELAQAAGLEMPAQDPRAGEADARKQKLFDVMARAAAFYAAELRQFGADAAQDYLSARRIAPGDAALFDMGWAATTRRGDTSRFRSELRDVSDETLIEVGLLKQVDDRVPYDFFRGRIMIPIHDARGRVIGFGGRAIGDVQPKYLNSPDTVLFDKGRTLFNLHRASGPARRKGRLVVVEGYLDVMAMHRAGIEEVVAPNGTAITETQLRMLWALAPAPILCLDGDSAGRKAAVRAAMLALPLIEPGKTLQFAFPPAGSDPDDLERSSGAVALSALLADPRSLTSVLWEHELSVHGSLNNPDHRALLQHRIGELLAMIKSQPVRAEYKRAFAQAMRNAQARQASRPTVQAAPQNLSIALEACVVLGLIRHPQVISSTMETLAGIAWRTAQFGEFVGALIDASVVSPVTVDTVWTVIERAGMSDIARRADSAATLGFRFVTSKPDDASASELVDAISRMPRR